MDLDPTSLFARVPDVLQNLTWSMLKPERDCAATGAFVAQVVHFKLERNGDQNNYPLHKLSAFIKGCSDVTLAAVSYGGLADWFIYNSAVNSKGLVSLVEKVGNGTWVLDYCKSYNFEGDPDLAGIGVSACVSAPVRFSRLLSTWARKENYHLRALQATPDYNSKCRIVRLLSPQLRHIVD
ncbi:hypothetical protein B0T09DRAFT_176446 [Sordaria sp. MPI-SDFR-AT-0083]|nr:hypothetical protein B0T09DRAFT_176446 [Sordaria sp. MPI-SDFR-AT-0083]